LATRCVGYINLDAAAMGPNFGASASPSLWTVIHEAAAETPNCREPDRTVLDAWVERSADPARPGHARIGELGGGSDHIGFLCHACVPSVSLSSGGSPGTAYHSLYDTLAWYRKIVGDDYEPALMITRMTNAIAARLADAGSLHDPSHYGGEIVRKLGSFDERIAGGGVFDSERSQEIEEAHERLGAIAARFGALANDLRERRHEPGLTEQDRERISVLLRAFDMRWCLGDGSHDDRPWFRNLYAAPDATSGYASWTLPGLQNAMHLGDADRYLSEAARLEKILNSNVAAINRMLSVVDP